MKRAAPTRVPLTAVPVRSPLAARYAAHAPAQAEPRHEHRMPLAERIDRIIGAPKATYTIVEVAEKLGVGEQTVRDHIRQQKLEVIRVGPKLFRVPYDALVAYLATAFERGSSPAARG